MDRYKYRSKKRFIVSLLILSAVLILAGNLNKDLKLKKICLDFFQPFLSFSTKTVQNTKKTFWGLMNFYNLKDKNEELKNKIEMLQNKLLENAEIRRENNRLNELLHFKSQLNFPVLPARVIGQDFSNWYNSIIVNKGKNENIKPNYAVISPKGIVGKVVEVFNKTSKIMLLSDKASEVGGLVFRTRDIGLLQGMDKDFLTFNYLPRTSDIKSGDVIITSGFDQIFPKGIILGVVSNVDSEDYDLFKFAEVIPSVNFNRLEEVFIILPEVTQEDE